MLERARARGLTVEQSSAEQLPFEDACVNFHETKRSVRTASSEQVRQPIYRGAVATWKRYGANLDPLRDILAPVFPEWDK